LDPVKSRVRQRQNTKTFVEHMDDANIDFTGLERRRLKIDTLFGNDIFGCYFLQLANPDLLPKGAPKVHETNSYSVSVQSSEAFVYKLPMEFFKFLLSYEKVTFYFKQLIYRDLCCKRL
jgi:hypothetical protein